MKQSRAKQNGEDRAKQHDEDLPARLDELDQAIADITEPRIAWIGGRLVTGPSLLDQVQASIAGQQGTSNGHAARPLPPIWLDAADVLAGIDVALQDWSRPGRLPALPRPVELARTRADHIRQLRKRPWTPEYYRKLVAVVTEVKYWANDIDRILNPVPKRFIAAPCPACDTDVVYRPDSAGENVRQPALQIIADRGCICLECKATWTPDLYMHLSRVLGFPAPAGVVAE
ncbi:hypothetical protein SEA_NAIRB_51 [Mycobacterium phage Nairb]|uniref:Uncharacterized protein n=5 Tax=Bernalvirus bernal13 TaxID=1982102 RepID=A0A2P1JRS6_9CAUD|nr:hypothetical protein FH37_gp51 [Mycobacterium phage Bernal13]AIT13465.1 hypothetical protein PBI_RONRAYGUN_52 [Mycobacterium phage RonRayGun]ASJ79132.1 hypothetical protein SEA_ZENTIME222_51 [Mycobacterium phage ZenTime222]AVO21839.1 hypothetical protein SEA_NAIRB_51 [Mycobacterium phage Nairb]QBP28897.1 hypothetical protein SEA_IBRAHIM_52 [Mycobacterium phage Ibrahim]QHB47456.1 hypothetical protein SEA_WHITTY_51 [Mycobacterium phage Whitty]